MNEEFVSVAKITKPRGLRGEVVAEILTGFPERFDELDVVFAFGESGTSRKLRIERHWFQKGRVILKFEGFDTIESVENLRDHEICILESEVVELEEDTYFDWDLEGCRVETASGEALGMVESVYRAGENINLVVSGENREFLIPFVKAICTDVEIENKLIRVDPPDGLLEF